jgi:chaperone required for assembly of F1-ATPase
LYIWLNQKDQIDQSNQPLALQATEKSVQCTHAFIGLAFLVVDPHVRLDHIRL